MSTLTELIREIRKQKIRSGSPPLARELLAKLLPVRIPLGIIPAHAGITFKAADSFRQPSVLN